MPKDLSELLSPGKLADAYAVTKHLGAGAFSEVKLAKKLSDDKKCAVKILERKHPEFNEVSFLLFLCAVRHAIAMHRRVLTRLLAHLGAAGVGDRIHDALQGPPKHC
jgi:serine/threonine protein kinase